MHALGQRRLNVGNLGVEPLDDLGGILAIELEDHPRDDFFRPVSRNHATANFGAIADFCHIRDLDRNAVANSDVNASDVFQIAQQTDATNEVLLLAQNHELPAHVGIVGRHGPYHVIERNTVLVQGMRIDANLVLQNVSADRKDIRDARNGLKLAFDNPVVNLAQIDVRGFTLGVGAFVEGQVVHEDLSETGGDRAQLGWLMHLGQFSQRLIETFSHDGSSKIDVHVVFEVHVDRRHAEGGGGLDLCDAGQTVHGRLDGKRNETLDLLRGHTVCIGEDRHHDRGNIRERRRWATECKRMHRTR